MLRRKRREIRSKYKNYKNNLKSKAVSAHTHVIHGKYEIEAPSKLSVIDNIEETLLFFDDIHLCIKKQRKILLKLRNVNYITTDAILYMLSQIEYNLMMGRKAQISGDVPEDENCKKIMETSGFFKHVYYSGALKEDPNTFAIETGTKVKPQVAKAVKDFAAERLVLMRAAPKGLFKSLIECMANTKNHAYKLDSIYTKWWLMASYDKDARKVHFTFLDNGLTIPETIRKNFFEYVKQIYGGQKDGSLIYSALNGEFRTKTGAKHRGKGLPNLYSTAKNNEIENLIIISRRGFVNTSTDSVVELNKHFYGTLISWDFV